MSRYSKRFTCDINLYTFGSKLLFHVKVSKIGLKIFNYLNKKWFFDKVYNEYITQTFFDIGYKVSYKITDRGIVEILGPMGLVTLVTYPSKTTTQLQTGVIYQYSFVILTSLTAFLCSRKFWLLFSPQFDFREIILTSIFLFYLLKTD